MADDAATVCGDKDDAATPAPFYLVECKSEPCNVVNSTDEDLLVFDESTLHIPVSIPTIKYPIVLLERCDKIWETLQLIRTIQIEKPTALTDGTLNDDCDEDKKEEEEEKIQYLDEVKESLSCVKIRSRNNDNIISPFKFSVQRTKRLYPCNTCGKQYLERRSLRKHSERVHGITLPLIRDHWSHRLALKKKNKATSVASNSKEHNRSEKLHNNEDSCEKITKTKPTSTATPPRIPAQQLYVKCTLCKRKVKSLREHLIHYHKIGGKTIKQLESSLLNKTTSSENENTTLTNEPQQDKNHVMDNEINTRRRLKVKRGTNYTFPSENAKKKLKLNSEQIQDPPTTMQTQILTNNPFKCDICLGIYATAHGLYKHNRVHKLRGETKENFHKFKCRYINSPFSKRYKLLVETKSSKMSANVKNINNKVNVNNTLQLNNSKYNASFNQTFKINRATRYSERMKKNNETTCICERSFRNPHTLFIHRKHCELCQTEDITTEESTRMSSDRDSGIGINITIKKRNDSYEIVGKDDEDKIKRSKTSNFPDLLPHISNYTKDLTKASTRQQVNTPEASKYSKDHSILKLRDADEDVIIDIEDEAQFSLNEDNTMEQLITQEDNKQDSSKQQNDEKTGQILNKVNTLKQMCQEVLDVCKSGNTENKECSRIKNQEMCKENNHIKSEEIHQENKRELRSKRYQTFRVELDHSYGSKIGTIQFDPLSCGYCKERFSTVKSYDNHQCPVKHGISFDEFSLQLPCSYCQEVLNNCNEFDAHISMKHFDHAYHCYNCPERFKTNKARLYHFHTVHKYMVCRICNKKISIAAKAFHEGYHLGFGYPCHKCKRAYTSNKNFYYHIQAVHSSWADNLMTCTICLKRVKFKTFRHHMNTHKHNVCHFCGRTFSDRVGLEYHTMIHHGTNTKLKCSICGTRFHTKKQLEMHEKIDGCNNDTRNEKGNCRKY